MIELPRVKLLVTEATRSTVTGPCKLGLAVPKFWIWIIGATVSPGDSFDGSARESPLNSGSGLLVMRTATGLLILFAVLTSKVLFAASATNQR